MTRKSSRGVASCERRKYLAKRGKRIRREKGTLDTYEAAEDVGEVGDRCGRRRRHGRCGMRKKSFDGSEISRVEITL